MSRTDEAIVVLLISLLSGLVVALITSLKTARSPEVTDAQRAEPFVGFLGGCVLGAMASIAWSFFS